MNVSLVKISEQAKSEIFEKTREQVFIPETPEEQSKMLGDADVLISNNMINVSTLNQCKKLKFLFIMSAGVETLPFEVLKEKNILVANASGFHAPQMSEQALGVMLAFSRSIRHAIQNQQKHYWEPHQSVNTLMGKTLCIVGTGSIGKGVAKKAAVFGMNVIGVKRHASAVEGFSEIYGIENLLQALPRANYILLLTPLTKETYHLFDEEQFASMKKEAVFINFSRGDTVNEDVLIKALSSKKIAGAALDVCHEEPLAPSSPLWDMENVIITPHTAGFVPDYASHAISVLIPNLIAFRKGEALPTQVNLTAQY